MYKYARQPGAVVVFATAVALAAAGCASVDDASAPASKTSADAAAATTPAAPSVSARLGVDLCTLLSPDEISNALGRQGLVPKRTVADGAGHVVAESCDWGSETEGFISVGWMDEPIPQWQENEYSRLFTEATGLRTTVNDWEGRFCAVYAERASGNIGVTITPSEEYLKNHPVSPEDGTCSRNQGSIISVIQRAQGA